MTDKNKICPRCHQTFECKSDDIENCQCASIELNKHQYDYIAKQYEDCLCINCLRLLAQNAKTL